MIKLRARARRGFPRALFMPGLQGEALWAPHSQCFWPRVDRGGVAKCWHHVGTRMNGVLEGPIFQSLFVTSQLLAGEIQRQPGAPSGNLEAPKGRWLLMFSVVDPQRPPQAHQRQPADCW